MPGLLRMRAVRDLLVALVIVFGVGSLAMLLARVSPVSGFGALFDGAFGSTSEFAETLVQGTALLFPALGIALAFRAGLFNIGAEGQLVLGGLAAGIVGTLVSGPPLAAGIATLLAGMIAGALWGGIAGILRSRFGANEVIATLMLNVVAALLATYVVNGPLHFPTANAGETQLLATTAWLPTLVPGTRLSVAVLIALLAAFVLWWFFRRTVFGYELRAAGEAPEAARRAGIDLRRISFLALTLSGALAGLGGATLVTGVLHRFNTGLSPGYGFVAIAVALVGNVHPLWIALASFAFGILQNGALSMQAEAGVPRDVVNVVEGLVIIALAGRRYVAARRST
jgi:general nucleoside transport system permease protein